MTADLRHLAEAGIAGTVGRVTPETWQAILALLDQNDHTWEAYRLANASRNAAERRVAALEEGLLEACRAECGPWFDEGSEKGKLDPAELADRIIARALLEKNDG